MRSNENQPVDDGVKVFYKMDDDKAFGPIEVSCLVWVYHDAATITEYSTDGVTWHKHSVEGEDKEYYTGHEALEYVVLPEMKKGGEWWKNIHAFDYGSFWNPVCEGRVFNWVRDGVPIRVKHSYIPEAYSYLDDAVSCLEKILDMRMNSTAMDKMPSPQAFIEEYCTIQVNPGRACGKTRWIVDHATGDGDSIVIAKNEAMRKTINNIAKEDIAETLPPRSIVLPPWHTIKRIYVNDWSYMTGEMRRNIYKFAASYSGNIKEVRIYAIG